MLRISLSPKDPIHTKTPPKADQESDEKEIFITEMKEMLPTIYEFLKETK